jgi:predicted CXXCH cytochrome family protein
MRMETVGGHAAAAEQPEITNDCMQRGRIAMKYLGAVAAVALGLGGMIAPAAAAAPSQADQQCLACHATPGFEKPLGNGQTLPLQIDGNRFAQSVHSPLGCAACHADVNLASHPPANNTISSRRDFSVGRVAVCGTCHSDQSKQWQTSVHAALVRDGNPVAPICTSCHSPHAVMKGAAEAMDTVPCKSCHGPIFTAYAESVHGQARSSGLAVAPLCFNCHGAHAVNVPSAVQGLKDVCLGCHAGVIEAHRTWLPNVELHFDVVSCPTCHVPNARRRVDLVLYNNTTQKETSEPQGVPEFEARGAPATATRPGLDAATLFTLLRTLNRPGVAEQTVFRGRLEVSTAVEAHQIVPSGGAISDCNTCHRAGANAFQSVVVSVAGPAGLPIRYGASESVLSSAFSIASIGGFYAIGGTRITFLDVLFVLALLGGIGGPAVHLIARWAFKRYLNRTGLEQRKG